MAHIVEVPVLVVGAGPVGVTLANLHADFHVRMKRRAPPCIAEHAHD